MYKPQHKTCSYLAPAIKVRQVDGEPLLAASDYSQSKLHIGEDEDADEGGLSKENHDGGDWD